MQQAQPQPDAQNQQAEAREKRIVSGRKYLLKHNSSIRVSQDARNIPSEPAIEKTRLARIFFILPSVRILLPDESVLPGSMILTRLFCDASSRAPTRGRYLPRSVGRARFPLRQRNPPQNSC